MHVDNLNEGYPALMRNAVISFIDHLRMIIADEYVTATDGKPHFKPFRTSKFYARNIGLLNVLIAELNRQFNV